MKINFVYDTNSRLNKTFTLFLFLLLCIGSLFLDFTFLNDSKIESKWLWFYSFVFLWSIISVFHYKREYNLTKVDFIIILLTLLIITHTYVIGIFSHEFVLILFSFPCLYFVFRANLTTDNLSFLFGIIVFVGFLLALYGIGQYLGIISLTSYFKIKGNFDNPAGYASALTFTIPFCLYFIRGHAKKIKFLAISVSIVIALSVTLSASRAGIITIITVYLYHSWNRKLSFSIKATFAVRIFFVSVCVVILVTLYFAKKDSADGRILIWRCTLEMIRKEPLLGYGYNSFNADYMLAQAKYFEKNPDSRFCLLADNVRHPFSEVLLWIISFGLIGFLTLFFFINYLIFYCLQDKNSINSTIKNSIFSVLVFSFFSYPFQYPFTWVIVCFSLATVSILNKRGAIKILKKYSIVNTVTFIISTGLLIYSFQQIQNRYKWHKIARISLNGKTREVLIEYQALLPKMKTNAMFLYNYAAELNYIGEYEGSLAILIECTNIFNDYDIQMLFASNYNQLKEYTNAIKHYSLASQMCPNRFMPLYELVLLYNHTEEKEKAFLLAEEIIKKEVKISSPVILRIKDEMRILVEK